tara:strand:- start:8468 stop:9178 length:711 start_codon:yes stop_codon:yes gene_type:complete
MDKIISIIPARIGSKRIKYKNLKKINGKHLIEYTIKCSLSSKYIDKTYVSTDSEKIKNVSLKCGASVPFLREKKFANDSSTDFDVIDIFLKNLKKYQNYLPDYIIYLRPTQPLRKVLHINNAIKKIKKNKVDCVRTTRESPYPPYWMKKINKKGIISPFQNSVIKYQNKITQFLPKVYICDGYVDIFRVKSITSKKNFPPKNQMSLLIDDTPYVDIDDLDDFKYCEYLINNYDTNF